MHHEAPALQAATDALLALAADPKRQHPHTDFTLEDAIRLTLTRSMTFGWQPPTSLAEVRGAYQKMLPGVGHVWLTGMAALDLLDAELDGRDLAASSRIA